MSSAVTYIVTCVTGNNKNNNIKGLYSALYIICKEIGLRRFMNIISKTYLREHSREKTRCIQKETNKQVDYTK